MQWGVPALLKHNIFEAVLAWTLGIKKYHNTKNSMSKILKIDKIKITDICLILLVLNKLRPSSSMKISPSIFSYPQLLGLTLIFWASLKQLTLNSFKNDKNWYIREHWYIKGGAYKMFSLTE